MFDGLLVDPTYGKHYDLINTRTGASLRDARKDQAAKSCGAAAFDACVEAAIKKLVKNRRAERSTLSDKLTKKLR
ncbi:MAG: hypothetical protein SFX73_32180 [Kofleriaceae bacterium]|nr:hypothetical protein [Kofleriaceae bacterium]